MYSIDFDNPWVRDATTPKKRLAAVLVVIVAPLLVYPSIQLGEALGEVRLGVGLYDRATLALMQTAAVFLPLCVVAVVGAYLQGRSAWRQGLRPLISASAGLVGGVCAFLLVIGLLFAAGTAETTTERAAPLVFDILVGLIVMAIQSTSEEVFFRGWVQPALCAQLGPWTGLIATSVLFGIVHLLGGGRSLPSLANTILAGFVFGLLALRTGGLWASVAAHFGWNYAESHLFGLDPNPGVSPLGSILNLDAVGPALWSGSSDGMNASLATTLVLLGCAVALILIRGRKAEA